MKKQKQVLKAKASVEGVFMDVLAAAMNSIKVAEAKGKAEARIRPAAKLVREVLALLQKQGFIGEFEFVDDSRGGEFVVRLVGRVNECGVVKPRFAVKKEGWEKYEQRFLPAKDVGILVVSTPQGLMTHSEAKNKGIGGRLLCYAY